MPTSLRHLARWLGLLGLLAATTLTQAEQFKVLVFSKTAGWHHESIPAGVAAIQRLGQLHDFGVFWTEDANRVMNDTELAKYRAVIFLLTTGDILNAEQEAAFERYIRAGGGFVGVHSAADTEHGWPWYGRLVGRMFQAHPANQTATLVVQDANFPGMDRFPGRFLFTEEWYQFGPTRSEGLRTLLTVDTTTFSVATEWGGKPVAPAGAALPISWYQRVDGGRSFYTALGHLPASYADDRFLHHLFGGIYWAATGKGFRAD
ncbi:MAG: ThuA domain-containing protein [Roseateles sp.]|uniref:ThuA domain-containing protein n=1 Tax=Roseateles sp. TaxID=1971397 RepID=UPI0040375888